MGRDGVRSSRHLIWVAILPRRPGRIAVSIYAKIVPADGGGVRAGRGALASYIAKRNLRRLRQRIARGEGPLRPDRCDSASVRAFPMRFDSDNYSDT
eukprot:5300010-Pyramimonas_sp.AAC.1